jgi:hypothetical protein
MDGLAFKRKGGEPPRQTIYASIRNPVFPPPRYLARLSYEMVG